VTAPAGTTGPTEPVDGAGADFSAAGGHGAIPTAGVPLHEAGGPPKDWPLWEVFVRSRRGLSHSHVGSLHAPDAAMALRNARDVYTRRQEGVSIWVVPAAAITASSPDEKDAFFDPAADKIYRHPTFYDIPEGVEHL
jgi:ring-1,2-phenylacetyl-CoA epoxidase subunit PaaB